MYLENSGEVLPKFCLGSEYGMEVDPAYTFSGGIRTYLYLLYSSVHVIKLDGTTCYIKKIMCVFHFISEDGRT